MMSYLSRRLWRLALACALLARMSGVIAAQANPNCENSQPNCTAAHRLKEPFVAFGSTDIEHDMVAGTITLRIAGAAFDPAEFVVERGQQFTVSDGKGVEQWELKGRVTQEAGGKYLFDALIKCGDIVVARENLTARQDESKTIRVDGVACPGKRKTFEADAKFLSMPGTKATVVEAHSFKVMFEVYVDENGATRSAKFLRREPPMPMSKDEIDNMASTVLTWTFDSDHCTPKCKTGYRIVSMMVN